MKVHFLFILLLSVATYQLNAQSDEPQNPTIQDDPFIELQDLFENFNFAEPGQGFQMDTMIMRQFGGSDLGGADIDQVMQEMMQMMQEQMQQFNFGDMPEFNRLFEELDFEQFELAPGEEKSKEKFTQKKKRKTYKL